MTPELNREYPELDDPKVFEQMVNLTVGQMKHVRGHLRRSHHAKAYVETISRKNIPLIGDLVAAAHLALLERNELKIINAIKGKHVASPLEIKYWSGTPFWLGPAAGEGGHAVKYSAVSRQTDR